MADETNDGLEQRVDKLEEGQQSILSKLDQLITGPVSRPSSDDDPPPGPHGRPADISEQVRLELERRDAEDKAASEAEAGKSEFQAVKDNVARLLEVKPQSPQPRRERMMWGKR